MKIERKEIEQIYGKYAQKLYLASYRILQSREEAEDVMQDTMLKVCAKGNLGNADYLEAYLIRSCINKSLDIIRKRQIVRNYQQEMAYSESKEAEKENGQLPPEGNLREYIIKLIAHLPASCRQAVSLKLIEGYDYEEIAQITQMSENSIRSNYMRGRQRLAELLKKEGLYERIRK